MTTPRKTPKKLNQRAAKPATNAPAPGAEKKQLKPRTLRNLNLAVGEELRDEWINYCRDQGRTQTGAFKIAFGLLKKRYPLLNK